MEYQKKDSNLDEGCNPLSKCMVKTINPRNNYSHISIEKLHVLIISKPFDWECQEQFLKVILCLQKSGIKTYTNQVSLEYAIKDEMIENYRDKSLIDKIDFDSVHIFEEETNIINRVITLGGDGTILFAIKMFYNTRVPPIISFGLGSVGFLCCFDSSELERALFHCLLKKRKRKSTINHVTIDLVENQSGNDVVKYDPYLQYRARLKVTVSPCCERGSIKVNSSIFPDKYKELPCGSILNALNECTLETGSFNQMFTVDLYLNENFLTRVTASGLIISTPTGSTAYNMSAGGSIVNTEVKAICVTPLNPLTLSFRPLILPFDCKITIKVPEGANDNPFNGCIDGDFKFQLIDGDELEIIGSEFPVPFVTNEKHDPIKSWMNRLASTVLSY
ncbi:unnamed protein product [Moneuplotes crassus]|uniref:NAD(+) kinase n=1 Tax=Euplotes crassus TaxID=5936 RepID=A0AAD1XGS8_EUPCR|nr:unnamed protein product [Moneuplotes crassus]